MNSAYFVIEIWHRKRLKKSVQVSDFERVVKGFNTLSNAGLLNPTGKSAEVIVKHRYVSSSEKSRTIARVGLVATPMVGAHSTDYAVGAFTVAREGV